LRRFFCARATAAGQGCFPSPLLTVHEAAARPWLTNFNRPILAEHRTRPPAGSLASEPTSSRELER